ncbi:hypothetical protein [Nocardioides antri]|uniref:Uncharacterized protein n=1 Tax=Nocardioides antri TaxID=2607659 RepID=A0A5B1M0S9_9ACTN|nr:hypothetical protein [Nocardioides antri]KAA1425719.1 hypothetical protein F0U47_18220 [Nocardioides antri]
MTYRGWTAPSPTKKPAIVLIVVLALVAVAAVVGVLLTRGGDDGADWNAFAGIDAETGELVVYDDGGEEVDRINPGVEGPLRAEGRGSFVAVSAEDAVSVVDVGEGEVVWSDQVDGSARWIPGTSAPLLLIGSPEGGELRLVDARSGTDLYLGDDAGLEGPLLVAERAAASSDGSTVVVADEHESVTVVVDVGEGEARSVAGRVVAVTDKGLVTTGTEDDAAVARFFNRDGEERGIAPLPDDVAGALLMVDETSVVGVVVGEDESEAFRVSADDDEPEILDDLGLTGVARTVPFPSSGRIVVSTDEGGAVLLDADGETVAELDGRYLPASGATGDPECVTLADGDEVVVHDLGSGDEIARGSLPGPGQLLTSVDGCAAGAPGLALGRDGAVDVPEDAIVHVSPDGKAALVYGGGVELVDLTDPDAEPVDLPDEVRTFVER